MEGGLHVEFTKEHEAVLATNTSGDWHLVHHRLHKHFGMGSGSSSLCTAATTSAANR